MPGDVFLLNQDIDQASRPVGIWPVRIGQIELPKLMELMRREQAGWAVLVRHDAGKAAARGTGTATASPDPGHGERSWPAYVLRELRLPPGAAPVVLRRSAPPKLVMAHGTAADLAGGGLVGNVGLSGGSGFNHQSNVSVRLNRLYELHVPAATALQAARGNVGMLILRSLRPSIMVDLLDQRDPGLAQALCASDWRRLGRDGHFLLLVANDVIHAGQITYSFDDD